MPLKNKTPEWEAETAPCPFEDDGFREVWIILLKMPKWRKKPLSAIEMSCTKLKRFDMSFSLQLVENAISGNYQGVVFQDTQRKYELWKQQKQFNNGQGKTGIGQIGRTFTSDRL